MAHKVTFDGNLQWWLEIGGSIHATLDGKDSSGKRLSCIGIEDWLKPFFTEKDASPGRRVRITVEEVE